ncbi:MAG: DUF305 domain-containing protein [Pseudomonadota bacterium]
MKNTLHRATLILTASATALCVASVAQSQTNAAQSVENAQDTVKKLEAAAQAAKKKADEAVSAVEASKKQAADRLAAEKDAAAAKKNAPAKVTIIQPGAPGAKSKKLSAEDAIKIAENSYSPDDVAFMQNMIPHHQQAVDMANLVEARTNSEALTEVAGRIKASQADEIAFMRDWLSDRGEAVPGDKKSKRKGNHKGHGGKSGHHMMSDEDMAMMGMATSAQLAALKKAKGTDFDEMFLTLMITHHKGAVDMVETLHKQPGSAYDPVLFEFTNDIVADQTAEINKMNALLGGLSKDPRANLAAGFRDAGEAISNMTLVAALPKPDGFFDPNNPIGLPPIKNKAESDAAADEEPAEGANADETAEAAEETPLRDSDDAQSNDATEWGERSPLLSFSQTDMAFYGDKLVTGSYHGFNIYNLVDGGMPELASSVVCPGGQGDVSVIGDLLIMSVEQTRGRVDCGLQGIDRDVSEERFRGLRIFNIADPARPEQVGQVQTCRGSHTHSIVSGPDENGKIIVYNSGTSSIREEEELDGCVGNVPGDNRTALFRIDVIEIPVDDPGAAKIIDSPTVFADDKTGRIAGLWQGGDHGNATQRTRRTDQCHDITVFPAAGLAAGACSGNGIIFDISDPRKPKRIDAVTDSGFAYWHSATFNNDGTKVLFTDEWGGGSRPRCRASDPIDWGADAIYDIVDGKLEFQSYYKIAAPQSDVENCVAHNGAVVPVPGRDIFVQAWYQGGLSVIDFTDSANPVELAYFDRGPVHEEKLVLGGYWSTYWYDGKIYGTEIARGLDVFELVPSDHLSADEIAAATLADQGAAFNPQQQLPVTWPVHPAVARAYVDQLTRDEAMNAKDAKALKVALNDVETKLGEDENDADLAEKLFAVALKVKGGDGSPMVMKRRVALADTLSSLADQLR